MLVKCKGCNNKIERNEAYKIILKGKNEYYCSEDEYRSIQDERSSRENLLRKVELIFNEVVTNTVLHKDLKTLSDKYTYRFIFNYVNDNEKKLTSVMSRNFDNQFGKIKYFVTILKNNLADYKPPKEEVVKEVFIEVVQMKYKPKQRKKSISDYINELE